MAGAIAQKNIVVIVVGIALLVFVASNFVKTIPVGRVGVATLFGNAQAEGYEQGIHIPVNPLYSWTLFDARQQTHLEKTQINNAIARNQAYIQLQSLEALKAISKDPASKVYFLDGSSPSPLPLMHLGDIKP